MTPGRGLLPVEDPGLRVAQGQALNASLAGLRAILSARRYRALRAIRP